MGGACAVLRDRDGSSEPRSPLLLGCICARLRDLFTREIGHAWDTSAPEKPSCGRPCVEPTDNKLTEREPLEGKGVPGSALFPLRLLHVMITHLWRHEKLCCY